MFPLCVLNEAATRAELVCGIHVATKVHLFHPRAFKWHTVPVEILENPLCQEMTTDFDTPLIQMDLALDLYIPHTKIRYHCVP